MRRLFAELRFKLIEHSLSALALGRVPGLINILHGRELLDRISKVRIGGHGVEVIARAGLTLSSGRRGELAREGLHVFGLDQARVQEVVA